MITYQDVLDRTMQGIDDMSHGRGDVHHQFLNSRRNGLNQFAGLIAGQITAAQCLPQAGDKAPALFDLAALQEFATGSITRCLGDEYAVYDGRRSPRIPNGDFLLMSRINTLDGQKNVFDRPASIRSEYDVPKDAWYLSKSADGWLPYAICLEIALQPCGFLSAYLGTPLRFPQINYFFRNLDGKSRFLRAVDARGQTVSCHTVLEETITSGTTIIQHFTFELSTEGSVFFKGCSSFGYFPEDSMITSMGLDGGRTTTPWYEKDGGSNGSLITLLDASDERAFLPKGRLRMIDAVHGAARGGVHGKGYAFALRENSPQDWFFPYHFYQDPVMPGSLGIEAAIQALCVLVGEQSRSNLGTSARPAISAVLDQEMVWKYRGQILPGHKQMRLEVHINKIEDVGDARVWSGDANIWVDDLRIYQIHNITLSLRKNDSK